jgi:DMSO reductase family type II enzyme chaperone
MDRGTSADRARVYRLLARVFQPPDEAQIDALQREDLPALGPALERLRAPRELLESAECLISYLGDADLEKLKQDYETTFESSGGLRCPPNETAHAPETPQEGLTRTFELADISGFYRAFGVEVTPGTERVDHIAAEVEFMHLLAVKEGVAEESGESANAELCRDAATTFLRDHLARWCPKLEASLEEVAAGPVYRTAGELVARFVSLDLGSRS